MGTILFECPKTGRAVSTGIETQPISFCRLSETWLEVYCPLCGISMEQRYGSLRKLRLPCASAKALPSEQDQIESYTRSSVAEIHRCPLWVISGHSALPWRLPVHAEKRTLRADIADCSSVLIKEL